MLYLLEPKDGIYSEMSPVGFVDFSTLGLREKELEDLLSGSLDLTRPRDIKSG